MKSDKMTLSWGEPPQKSDCRDIGRVPGPLTFQLQSTSDEHEYQDRFNGERLPLETVVRASMRGKWGRGPVTYEIPSVGRVWLWDEGWRAEVSLPVPEPDAEPPRI